MHRETGESRTPLVFHTTALVANPVDAEKRRRGMKGSEMTDTTQSDLADRLRNAAEDLGLIFMAMNLPPAEVSRRLRYAIAARLGERLRKSRKIDGQHFRAEAVLRDFERAERKAG